MENEVYKVLRWVGNDKLAMLDGLLLQTVLESVIHVCFSLSSDSTKER